MTESGGGFGRTSADWRYCGNPPASPEAGHAEGVGRLGGTGISNRQMCPVQSRRRGAQGLRSQGWRGALGWGWKPPPMSLLRHFSRNDASSSRRTPRSDAEVAQRLGIALGAILIGVLVAGVWLVVRGLA